MTQEGLSEHRRLHLAAMFAYFSNLDAVFVLIFLKCWTADVTFPIAPNGATYRKLKGEKVFADTFGRLKSM